MQSIQLSKGYIEAHSDHLEHHFTPNFFFLNQHLEEVINETIQNSLRCLNIFFRQKE